MPRTKKPSVKTATEEPKGQNSPIENGKNDLAESDVQEDLGENNDNSLFIGIDTPTEDDLKQQANMDSIGADEEIAERIRKTAHELRQDVITAARLRDKRQDRAQTIGTYQSAAKTHKILNAVIAKVETDREDAYWVCYDGPMEVVIPFSDTFTSLDPRYLKHGATRAEHNEIIKARSDLLNNSLGLSIPFIITRIDGNKATASRTLALQRIRARYFGRDAINRVKEGDFVDATIVTVGQHAAFVNVYGVDVRIGKPFLSYRYIPNISEVYSVGDNIRVMIKELEEQPGKLPSLRVSGLEAEQAEWPELLHRVHKGDHVLATVKTVTVIREESKIHMTFWLNNIGLPAFSTSAPMFIQDDIRTGNQVLFQINGITNNGNVHGTVIRQVK